MDIHYAKYGHWQGDVWEFVLPLPGHTTGGCRNLSLNIVVSGVFLAPVSGLDVFFSVDCK